MKKSATIFYFLFAIFVIIYLFPMASAQVAQKCAGNDTNCQINNAYTCLNNKTTSCGSLTPDQKVFTFLATGQCQSNVLNDSNYQSNVVYTAKAVLGLKGNSNGNSVQTWLTSQNATSNSLAWLLQIDTPNSSSCTVTYGSTSQTVTVNSDKTLSSLSGGNCLSISSNGYWLNINPSCYIYNFTTSCNLGFTTSLLYQNPTSNNQVYYVSGNTVSSSASGNTNEVVKASCFKSSSSSSTCDYQSTLWAVTALSFFGNDVSNYIPYLVTLESANEQYLPESFLFYLTGQNQQALLSQQITTSQGGAYWSVSPDKYYDTAVAMFSLQSNSTTQGTNTQNWLLSNQGSDGCWNGGNIRDTAFLLYSIWPRSFSLGGGTTPVTNNVTNGSCQQSGYFCSSTLTCNQAGGQVLSGGYSCSGVYVCCTKQLALATCTQQQGQICNSNQNCIGGSPVSASDIGSGQTCCVQGSCQLQTNSSASQSQCQIAGGNCRFSCQSGETESAQSCTLGTDLCCLPQSSSSGGSLWLWIIIILIILVVLGIVFREKLRMLFFRINSGSEKGKGPFGFGGPRPPSGSSGILRPVQRNILPPQSQRQNPPQRQRPRGEIDDVLNKLKELGK